MKYILYCGFFSLALLSTSCENYKDEYEEQQKEIALMKEVIGSLEEEERLVSGAYKEAMETLNTLNDTLDGISLRNKKISKLIQQRELSEDASVKAEILMKVNALVAINESAKAEVKKLKVQAHNYKVENVQLKKMIAQVDTRLLSLEEELASKQTTIVEMDKSLTQLESQVSEVSSELAMAYLDLKTRNERLGELNVSLGQTIDNLKNKNEFISKDAKALVLCGTRKELRKKRILNILNAKKLRKDYKEALSQEGEEINFFVSKDIPCNGNVLYVLPQRDPSSYEITNGTLKVLNAKAFWATDKSVVLVKK